MIYGDEQIYMPQITKTPVLSMVLLFRQGEVHCKLSPLFHQRNDLLKSTIIIDSCCDKKVPNMGFIT